MCFSEVIPKISHYDFQWFLWQYYRLCRWIDHRRFLYKINKCDFIFWNGKLGQNEFNATKLEIQFDNTRLIQVLQFMATYDYYRDHEPEPAKELRRHK